jgi:AcrR family transcriptional regulator
MAAEGRGDRTRRTMIDAAERLIAEHGIAGLSLREVAVSAGQRNHSAVQYHFGSKAQLVEAVFAARMTPIDARRHDLLVALEREGGTDDLAALCEVAIRPLAEAVLVDPPGWYGRFLAQISRSQPEVLSFDRPALASLKRTSALMLGAMGAVPPALRSERLEMAFRAAVQMLADQEEQLASHRPAGPASTRRLFVAHLVDLVHAMVSAPPSPALLAELEAVTATR